MTNKDRLSLILAGGIPDVPPESYRIMLDEYRQCILRSGTRPHEERGRA
jgi:hypothetical protein